MPTPQEYQDLIQSHDHDDLLDLHTNRNRVPWNAGKALEYLIIRAFELEGCTVRYPYSVMLDETEVEQVDGVVYFEHYSIMIETKDWSTSVNIEPIAKIRNQLLRRLVNTIGLIFSQQGFTEPAATLARFTAPQTILLWDGKELTWALNEHKMRESFQKKYRSSIEDGNPLYNILEEIL